MTPAQARHLLALIADLYALASTPEPPPAEPPVPATTNNKRETTDARTGSS